MIDVIVSAGAVLAALAMVALVVATFVATFVDR